MSHEDPAVMLARLEERLVGIQASLVELRAAVGAVLPRIEKLERRDTIQNLALFAVVGASGVLQAVPWLKPLLFGGK